MALLMQILSLVNNQLQIPFKMLLTTTWLLLPCSTLAPEQWGACGISDVERQVRLARQRLLDARSRVRLDGINGGAASADVSWMNWSKRPCRNGPMCQTAGAGWRSTGGVIGI